MKSLKIFSNIGLLLLFLLALFFFEPSFSNLYYKFRGVTSVDENNLLRGEIKNLKFENKDLKNKLSESKGKTDDSYKVANVYSEYPFNDRRSLVIDVGSKDGIAPGMAVLVGEHSLIGKIDSVTSNKSTVQTIFDPAWQSSVVIGEARVKAVLRGGNPPYLDLIPKESVLLDGALVSNISEKLPINLLFGEIINISPTTNDAWQNAKLKTFYDLDILDQVRIVIDFL